MFAPSPTDRRRHDRAILVGALLLLSALAAAVIVGWQASPYGRYLGHDAGGGALVLEMTAFAAGWLLMIVAMMLPTTIPLVASFAILVGRRDARRALVGLLVAGYLVTWSAFGAAAYVADRLIHVGVETIPLLATHPQLVMGATLLVAGLWQFSPLKYRCLDECRSPLGFVLHRWRGVEPRREAFGLGIAHGMFCIGCCWSMMLVMFGVGMGNLAWMLLLGAVMAVEKNATWGRRISRPLGVGLLLAALLAISA